VGEFDLMFGEGVSREGCVLDLAVEHDIVKKSGSWFSYGDSKIGQGRDGAKTFLQANPDLFTEIEGLVRTKIFGAQEPELAGVR
ncbi:DNA recombination/repair protein RecA, partial [bacterium]|nr:DNA recombination/repair protein RecA [bacterium]